MIIFPTLPLIPVDHEELERATRGVALSHGLRAALLSPLDQLQVGLEQSQQLALAQVRAAFTTPGPFSYVPVAAFLWQWAAYAVLIAPERRVKETLNDLIAAASDSYARSPLFKALLLSSDGEFSKFVGMLGQWGSLFLNHGVITMVRLSDDSAQLVFSGHDVHASYFYVPGFLRGWMRHFGEVGEVEIEEVARGQRFLVTLRWGG
jgi:hypothetical protein